MNVTPWWPLGVVKVLSIDCSPWYSSIPQLIETTDTPGRAAAVATAVNRSLLLVSVFASTRSMLAPGAMACAHSMSRASSISQVPLSIAGPGRVRAGQVRGLARLVVLGEAWRVGQAERLVELGQVARAESLGSVLSTKAGSS